MCRFVLYLGPELTLDQLITKPRNSIIHQSHHAEHRQEPLNGDGFGVGWYSHEVSPEPALFRSIQPAWNNMNLRHLARVTRSTCLLAHVRAASPGLGVSEPNCHPFRAGRYTFMHNGYVAGFRQIKRALRAQLSDAAYAGIAGSTDSEHVFALLQDRLDLDRAPHSTSELAAALGATIADVAHLLRKAGVTDNSHLNLALTDGHQAVITRHVAPGHEANSLFVHQGAAYHCEDGVCRMQDADTSSRAVLVASEPLSDDSGWDEVPSNHLVRIDADHSVSIEPIPGI